MQISSAVPQGVVSGSLTQAAPLEIVGTPVVSTAAPSSVGDDTVEISEEATQAAGGRVNPKGKATGHARVAQNIEKNVAKLIERETARILGAGGEASSLDAFKSQVEGIAAAYSADPSGSPAKVLSQIRDAVKGLRAGEVTEPVTPPVVPPTEPAPVDGEIVPVDGEVVPEPTVPPVDGEVVPPVGDAPITVDLRALRMV
jgi:hypothetical protein